MCGAVQVSTAAPFLGALYCHCKRCQRRSGTTRSMTALCPQAHQFVAYASPLEQLPDDGLPRFPERLGATEPL
jgi:hypothetical protein